MLLLLAQRKHFLRHRCRFLVAQHRRNRPLRSIRALRSRGVLGNQPQAALFHGVYPAFGTVARYCPDA